MISVVKTSTATAAMRTVRPSNDTQGVAGRLVRTIAVGTTTGFAAAVLAGARRLAGFARSTGCPERRLFIVFFAATPISSRTETYCRLDSKGAAG